MPDRTIATLTFALADQQRFAELSGDYNPVHLEPVRARRELVGGVVVHGMHVVLRALDAYLATLREGGVGRVRLTRLEAKFRGPISLGRAVDVVVGDGARGAAALVGRDAHSRLFDVRVQWEPVPGSAPEEIPAIAASGGEPSRTPRALTFAEVSGREGAVPLYLDAAGGARAFPHLVAMVGATTLAQLFALTRLVGMECPGLHSLFTAFTLDVAPVAAPGRATALRYAVTAADSRVGRVIIRVDGPTVGGTLQVMLRPGPQSQPAMDAVRGRVDAREFTDVCALVVGGSRGLGEVTAKIVAAGGGHPIVTYRAGAADAERVAGEITAAGGTCTVAHCDVDDPGATFDALAAAGLRPSQLYYFPTPRIFVAKEHFYSRALLDQFVDVYVDGLVRLHQAYRARWKADRVALFYPSSVALDESTRNLEEYAAAKAAGESVCRHLARHDRALGVVVERLPRVATDQTLTLIDVPAADALLVMLPIVRRVAGLVGAAPPA